MEALMNIRTAGGFADGVQTSLTESGLKGVYGFEVGARLTEPLRQARGRKDSFDKIDLDEIVLGHEPSFWHVRT